MRDVVVVPVGDIDGTIGPDGHVQPDGTRCPCWVTEIARRAHVVNVDPRVSMVVQRQALWRVCGQMQASVESRRKSTPLIDDCSPRKGCLPGSPDGAPAVKIAICSADCGCGHVCRMKPHLTRYAPWTVVPRAVRPYCRREKGCRIDRIRRPAGVAASFREQGSESIPPRMMVRPNSLLKADAANVGRDRTSLGPVQPAVGSPGQRIGEGMRVFHAEAGQQDLWRTVRMIVAIAIAQRTEDRAAERRTLPRIPAAPIPDARLRSLRKSLTTSARPSPSVSS